MGICGTYNGQNAIVTCGHGYDYTPYVTYANTRIGQVVYNRANTIQAVHDIDAYGDFSIITLSGNNTITNEIVWGERIRGTISSLAVGTVVYKYGVSSGYSYGNVRQADVTSIIESVGGYPERTYYIRGLTVCEMYNSDGSDAISAGDSGGPVYIQQGSNYLLFGLVQSKIDDDYKADSTMRVTPISYASEVGFTTKITD